MGKDGSKKFRDRIRKSAEVHLEGKDGTRKRSESEILAMYYSEQDIKRGEKRIEKRIAKNKREYERQGKRYPEADNSERNYYYVRKKVDSTGKINSIGITEDDYNNPKCLGYKAKMMISAVASPNGPHQIQVEHHGEYTDEEKIILKQIEKMKKNLEEMQEAFKYEDSER